MAPDGDASETSPLLSERQDRSTNGILDSVPVDVGLTTDTTDSSGDLERRKSVDESRAAQFEGAPDVQKKLKYILPALSIGVCIMHSPSPTISH